ncbi:hypothetical protein [Georgenia yuyongxinii]
MAFELDGAACVAHRDIRAGEVAAEDEGDRPEHEDDLRLDPAGDEDAHPQGLALSKQPPAGHPAVVGLVDAELAWHHGCGQA